MLAFGCFSMESAVDSLALLPTLSSCSFCRWSVDKELFAAHPEARNTIDALRAFRVKGVTTDSYTLERGNTTNTEFFTPGQGSGSARKVSTWVDLDRTMNHATSGGDAKTVNVKFIESDNEIVLNDGFNAVQRTFDMDADMIGSPAYEALRMLSETNADTVVRQRAKTGALSLIPAKVSFNEEETLTEGQAVVVKGTFNAQNKSTRYAA
jgi:hypothetical protein